MSRVGAATAILALVGVAIVPPLAAQVCAGLPSLRERPLRLTATAAHYTYATALGLSLTGGRTIYGTLGFGRTRDPELDASTYPISAEIGADIAIGDGLFLCPVVSAAVSLGPYDFELSQYDFRYVDRGAGLGLAGVAVSGRWINVIVAGSVRAARVTGTYWPTGSKAATSSGWSQAGDYWLAGFSVGVEMGQTLTIRPGITWPFRVTYPEGAWFASPFGRKPDEVSLGIAVSIGLGRRGRATR